MNNSLIVNKQEIKETAILTLPDIIEKSVILGYSETKKSKLWNNINSVLSKISLTILKSLKYYTANAWKFDSSYRPDKWF